MKLILTKSCYEPFLYTIIAFILISCNSVSTPCYMGVLPFAERARLNDSIIFKLEQANQKNAMETKNICRINKDLQLSDTLTHPIEVRIYENEEITNYSSLFRMCKTEKGQWKSEFFEHYDAIIGQTKLKTKRTKLSAKHGEKFVYANLLRSQILHLPDISTIHWKLKKRTRKTVELIVGKGKTKGEITYQNSTTSVAILDGVTYTVQLKSGGNTHAFSYDNPESYLKHFPNVDELIYMNEILETIKNEFNIWNKL